MDYLESAMTAMKSSLELIDAAEEGGRYSDMYMRRSEDQLQRALTLALISLAGDIRRIAEALEEKQRETITLSHD